MNTDVEIASHDRTVNPPNNTFSPISQLPSEVFIAVILEMLLDSEYIYPDSREVVYITHVCRQWRHVAINHPLLWIHFSIYGDHGVREELARRTQGIPINICVHSGGTGNLQLSKSTLDFISSNIHRVKELVIDDVYPRFVSSIIEVLNQSAPLVEAVELEYDGSDPEILLSIPQFFGQKTSRLRKLSITGFAVDWNWPVFSHLTDLEVRRVTPLFSLSTVRAMPAIQKLEVWGLLSECPPDYNGGISESAMVDLSSLKELEISEASFRDISFFLNHLRYPSTTSVGLHIEPDAHDLTHDIVPFHRPREAFAIRWRNLTLSFHTLGLNVGVNCAPLCSKVPCLKTTLQALGIYPSSHHPTMFFVDVAKPVTDSEWMTALSMLPNLLSLEVFLRPSSVQNLFSVLGMSPQREDGSTDTIYLPKLCNMRVVVGREIPDTDYVYLVLHTLLSDRYRLGVKIQNFEVLTLGQPRLDVTRMNEICGFVNSFYWKDISD